MSALRESVDAPMDVLDDIARQLGDALCREEELRRALRALVFAAGDVAAEMDNRADGDEVDGCNWEARLLRPLDEAIADARRVLP